MELIELGFALLVCLVPFAVLIGVVVWALAAGRRGNDAQRIAALEASLWQLQQQHGTLASRLSRLETGAVVEPTPRATADGPGERSTLPDGLVEATPPAAPEPLADPSPASTPASAPVAPPTVGDAAATTPPTEALVPEAPTEAPATGASTVSAAPTTQAPSGEQAPASPASPGGSPPPTTPTGTQAPPPAPPPAKPSFDWERWVGVRGAAALGASVLVLAGIFFFQYSIEHGLITPAMRMIMGTVVGLGCVLVSELRLRRTHTVLAGWIAGAGIAILYVAFWAGLALYQLYPQWAAGVLMVSVTGACVALALARRSQVIALLGLLGGFITPLALSSGSDQPIPLFGYLLILDGAMLWLAYKRRWAWMALLCLGLTALYQNAWLFENLDQPRVILGVAIVAVFAVIFAALPKRAEEGEKDESVLWKLARSAGVLLPLFFTVPLAMRQDLGATFWPTAVQLVLLCIAACWVGKRHGSALLPSGAAVLAISTVLGFAVSHGPSEAQDVWQLVGLALSLALVFHVFAELDPARASTPAWLVVLSMLAIATLAAPFALEGGLWPWAALFAGLLAMGVRLGGWAGREQLQLAVAALGALGLGVMYAGGAGKPQMPNGALFMGVLVVFAVGMQLAGVVRREARARRFGDHAAALFALVLIPLMAMVLQDRAIPLWAFYAGTIALIVLALLAVARTGASFWLPLTLAASALAHGVFIARRAAGPFDSPELPTLFAVVLLFSLWPVVAPRSTRNSAWAWRTAALAGPLYLLHLRHVWLDVLGPSAIGLLAISLGLLSVGAATASRARGPNSPEASRVALVWLTAVAAGFVTLAIPLQLDREWITIGWALEALALIALWRRFDHTGLKYLAFALVLVVGVRLVGNPYVLGYYERGSVRIFNWLSYTYLVPAASLFGIWGLLHKLEVVRRRPWERSLFPSFPLMANLAASAAICVLFAWVNLTIIDWFATGEALTIPTERMAARDLTMSIAWALFALMMLGFGLWQRSTGLRVASLGLILVTVGKVFLYDLAHLSDLYRVASLVGLALSLIVISFVYQRFVFRTTSTETAQ